MQISYQDLACLLNFLSCLKHMQQTNDSTYSVPSGFPTDYFTGAVSGFQTKLLARKIDDKFVVGPTRKELWARWDNAEDLARQLMEKTLPKLRDGRITDVDVYYAGLEKLVRAKDWDLSDGEIKWLMGRTRVLVSEQLANKK